MKLITLIIIASLTSCTLTVSPDGSRSYAPHPESIRIILDK